jgi:CO/xanthine dehydrogenase Mo-binding subunit
MRTAQVAERVTGRTRFVDDLAVEGMLHGSFVRSPFPHARIAGVDISLALDHPAVRLVLTAADLARSAGIPRFGPLVTDQPVLADGKARYEGEPVALVVADSLSLAREAAARVVVDWEPLPAILTVEEAMAAAPLHDPDRRPAAQEPWRLGNVMGEWEFGWGSLGAAEKAAAHVVTETYSAPFAHHFAIETHGCICIPTDSGMRIISATQHPFILRRIMSQLLDLAPEDVVVEATPMGGSFGSKGYAKVEPAAAMAARRLGRPVKVVLSAEESFATAQREASVIHARTGFDSTGRIAFQDLAIDFLVGAYSDISPRVVAKSGLHALAAYHAPAARVRARGIFTTTPPTTAFRGFGSVHTAFAVEGQMERAARLLGHEPVALRLSNIRAKGARSAYDETPVDGDWQNLLRMAESHIREHPSPDADGVGVAFGVKTCIPATRSRARVRQRGDGSVVVEVGTSEIGQGTPALLATLAAEQLGVPVGRVHIVAGQTDSGSEDALTASSRSVVHMGNAVMAACRELVERRDAGSPDANGELVGDGEYTADADPDHPLGGPTPFYEAVATAVEIRVDRDTGLIDVLRTIHATDAGLVLDRDRAMGLDEGGLVMGLGLATSEALRHGDDGRLLNGSSLDYRIPTVWDRPSEMVSLFQENRDGPGPFGAKGLAEGGILAVAPALAAALREATGTDFAELPFSAERVWRAIHGQAR